MGVAELEWITAQRTCDRATAVFALCSGSPGEVATRRTRHDDHAGFVRELAARIEPLRALRFIHYSAWIARRWHDPAFPHAFPWFNTQAYWERHVLELREQFSLLSEPMWAADLLH